jgi:hypothetical protein
MKTQQMDLEQPIVHSVPIRNHWATHLDTLALYLTQLRN